MFQEGEKKNVSSLAKIHLSRGLEQHVAEIGHQLTSLAEGFEGKLGSPDRACPEATNSVQLAPATAPYCGVRDGWMACLAQ